MNFSTYSIAGQPWTLVKASVVLLISMAVAFLYNIEADLQLPLIMTYSLVGVVVSMFVTGNARSILFSTITGVALFHLFGWVTGTITVIGVLLMFLILSMGLARRNTLILASLLLALVLALKIFYITNSDLSKAGTVIGGFLMFRTYSFILSTKWKKVEYNIYDLLHYLLLLPNAIFAIFPVVDFKEFVHAKKYGFNNDSYIKGVKWIALGVIYLLIYRILYYYILPNKNEISNIIELFQFHVVNYLLVFRLIGIFILSVGIICLYGFDLPKVFNRMFLAESFSDLWRRLNIYWKDFVMNYLYFPVYFKLRKKIVAATFVSVLLTFIVNWFLHAFQWLWILGNFPLRATDVLYWGIFGVLVGVNTVMESRGIDFITTDESKPFYLFRRAVKVTLMFLFMCLIWTFWSNDTLDDYFSLMHTGLTGSRLDFLLVSSVCVVLFGIMWVAMFLEEPRQIKKWSGIELNAYFVLTSVLVVCGLPTIRGDLQRMTSVDIDGVYEAKLNDYDQMRMFRGYYESILSTASMTDQLTRRDANKPKNWEKLDDIGMRHQDPNTGFVTMTADTQVWFKDKLMTINKSGIRDKDYDLERRPGILRIALMGGSNEVGSGVGDNETFENLAEELLNSDLDDSIEIINFSITGIHIPEQLLIYENKVRDFRPDLVFYCTHSNEELRNVKSYVDWFFKENWQQGFPELKDHFEELKVDKSSRKRDVALEMMERKIELTDLALVRFKNLVEDDGSVFILLNIPSVEGKIKKQDVSRIARWKDMGMEIVDMADEFVGFRLNELRLADWDYHFNLSAHKRMGQRFYKELKKGFESDGVLGRCMNDVRKKEQSGDGG